MKNGAALLAGLLVGALGSNAFANSQRIDIQSIQSAIAAAHAKWQVRESWVTRLSPAERQRLLGSQVGPRGELNFESVQPAGAKPTGSFDWRNVDGVNWLGPVMNQGNCGSCVAFSTVATLEAQVSISFGVPWLRPTFSPQQLFACGGGGCETGWRPEDAAEFLKDTGIVDEACLPYTSGSTGEDVECSAKCSDASQRSYQIVSSDMPTSYGGSVDEVKAALKKGPLVTTLMVYEDFLAYGGGVYKHVTGKIAGGHAVSLVGYDDEKRAWLIRNSWGPEWGEGGFAWVSWDDVSGVGSDTWHFDVPVGSAYLSVVTPSDREFVSGSYNVTVRNKGVRGSIRIHVADSSGRDVAALACSSKTDDLCSAAFDTTQVKEGYYTVFAESGGSVKSQVRELFVLNSEPKMSLSFGPASGVDLTAPLKGRPEFLVQAKSSPIPIQHVEFRVFDSTGKIASTKSNDYVLENMKMGWRTLTVKDGQYKIQFHGETKYNGQTYSVDSNTFDITVRN